MKIINAFGLFLPPLMSLGDNGEPAGFVDTTRLQGSAGFRNAAESSLANTVSGGNLPFGGPGGQASTQLLAEQAIQPVLSQFVGSGRGPGRSGLADVEIARAAATPFAARFGEERALQQQAAQSGETLETTFREPFFEDTLSELLGLGLAGTGILSNLGIGGGDILSGLSSGGSSLFDSLFGGGGGGDFPIATNPGSTVLSGQLDPGTLFGLDGSGQLPPGLSGLLDTVLAGNPGSTVFGGGNLGLGDPFGLGGTGGGGFTSPGFGPGDFVLGDPLGGGGQTAFNSFAAPGESVLGNPLGGSNQFNLNVPGSGATPINTVVGAAPGNTILSGQVDPGVLFGIDGSGQLPTGLSGQLDTLVGNPTGSTFFGGVPVASPGLGGLAGTVAGPNAIGASGIGTNLAGAPGLGGFAGIGAAAAGIGAVLALQQLSFTKTPANVVEELGDLSAKLTQDLGTRDAGGRSGGGDSINKNQENVDVMIARLAYLNRQGTTPQQAIGLGLSPELAALIPGVTTQDLGEGASGQQINVSPEVQAFFNNTVGINSGAPAARQALVERQRLRGGGR